MSIKDEARALANVAAWIARDESTTFQLDEQYHGQEEKVIEGAQNILRSEGETETTFTVITTGYVVAFKHK